MFLKLTNGQAVPVTNYIESDDKISFIPMSPVSEFLGIVELFSDDNMGLKTIDTDNYTKNITNDGVVFVALDYVETIPELSAEEIQNDFNIDVDFRITCLELGV